MGLTNAYAAGFRARTKVYKGLVDVKMLAFNPDAGGLEEVGTVRSFELGEPILSNGAYQINFNVAEDGIATAEKLATCQFQIDGNLYKVIQRATPISHNKRLWRFIIAFQGYSNTVP